MSLFSLSAPTFTLEDEYHERQSLSESERKQVKNDLFGFKTTESPQLLSEVRQILESKVLQMPPEKKSAYLQALARCPEIVDQESNPNAMLRAEDYDPLLAAVRLTKYWTTRLSLFGESAFLPMTVDGALQNDTSVLDTQFCEILPNDKSGRSVILYNRSRICTTRYDRDSLLRVAWYVIHQASKEESAQKAGFVLLVDARQYTIHRFDRKLAKLLVDGWVHVIPIRLRALHICCSSHRSIFEFVCPALKLIIGKVIRCRTIVHFSEDVKEILFDLEDYGINEKNLPTSLGGRYDSSNTTQLEQRSERDSNIPARLLIPPDTASP